jgi:hypothetical protein
MHLTNSIEDVKKEFNNSMEHVGSKVDQLQLSFSSYASKTDALIGDIKVTVDDHSKQINQLKVAERKQDLYNRSNNVVVYGVPNIEGAGLNPFQWLEATRKRIQDHLGIDLPPDSIDKFLRMGPKKNGSPKSAPAPVKIYFVTAFKKAAFYNIYLQNRKELGDREIWIRDDLPLEVRKFRADVNAIRKKLFQLKYKVKFVDGGGTLQVISPDGKQSVKYKTVAEVIEFAKLEKIDQKVQVEDIQ